MAARIGTNLSRLRSSARTAKIPATDTAALRLAEHLAQLLDVAAAAGSDDLADEITVYAKLGPLYLRTLTALALTRDGRGLGDTQGAPGGVSADVAARDQLEARRAARDAARHTG